VHALLIKAPSSDTDLNNIPLIYFKILLSLKMSYNVNPNLKEYLNLITI